VRTLTEELMKSPSGTDFRWKSARIRRVLRVRRLSIYPGHHTRLVSEGGTNRLTTKGMRLAKKITLLLCCFESLLAALSNSPGVHSVPQCGACWPLEALHHRRSSD
jgi:hypothetical protein